MPAQTYSCGRFLPCWLRLGLLALAITASGGAQAAAPSSLSAGQARHLLLRTGFAPTQAEVDALVGQSAELAVQSLLDKARAAQPLHPLPPLTVPMSFGRMESPEAQRAARQQQLREGLQLKTWWLREMLETPTPLAERMTLFWHNHFATSQLKVVRSQVMWQQQQVLRANALGNFSTLLHEVAKTPAMLVYLDGANSRRDAPNENFAREVMELFVLGEASQHAAGLGGYSEQDIKEAARAFTGWSVDRDDFSFRQRPFFHDNGSKTLFGRTGNLDGDAVLDLMLAQPAASRFIAGKLWREFVAPAADAAQGQADLQRVSDRLRDSGWDIAQALRTLLLSDSFWAPENRGALIKSPVELVVGTLRQFGFTYTDVTPLVLKTAQLGQNLLAPPNVKGWPGYTDWINATTLLERKRLSEQLFRAVAAAGDNTLMGASPATGGEMGADMAALRNPQAVALLGREGALRTAEAIRHIRFDPEQWLRTYAGHADQEPSEPLKAALAQAMLAAPATQEVAPGTVGVAYVRTLALDPAYQLK